MMNSYVVVLADIMVMDVQLMRMKKKRKLMRMKRMLLHYYRYYKICQNLACHEDELIKAHDPIT